MNVITIDCNAIPVTTNNDDMLRCDHKQINIDVGLLLRKLSRTTHNSLSEIRDTLNKG